MAFTYGEPPFYGQVKRDNARLNLRLVCEPVFVGDIREREQLLAASMTVASAAELRQLFLQYQAAGVDFLQTAEAGAVGRARPSSCAIPTAICCCSPGLVAGRATPAARQFLDGPQVAHEQARTTRTWSKRDFRTYAQSCPALKPETYSRVGHCGAGRARLSGSVPTQASAQPKLAAEREGRLEQAGRRCPGVGAPASRATSSI